VSKFEVTLIVVLEADAFEIFSEAGAAHDLRSLRTEVEKLQRGVGDFGKTAI
jgi:hypothetical protein